MPKFTGDQPPQQEIPADKPDTAGQVVDNETPVGAAVEDISDATLAEYAKLDPTYDGLLRQRQRRTGEPGFTVKNAFGQVVDASVEEAGIQAYLVYQNIGGCYGDMRRGLLMPEIMDLLAFASNQNIKFREEIADGALSADIQQRKQELFTEFASVANEYKKQVQLASLQTKRRLEQLLGELSRDTAKKDSTEAGPKTEG